MTVAVRCLSDAIDGCGITRAELADLAGIGEAQFSKLTHAAAIDLIDALPNEVVVPWLQKMGIARGFEVRELRSSELSDEITKLLDQIVTLRRLASVRTRQIKVTVSPPVAESRRLRA